MLFLLISTPIYGPGLAGPLPADHPHPQPFLKNLPSSMPVFGADGKLLLTSGQTTFGSIQHFVAILFQIFSKFLRIGNKNSMLRFQDQPVAVEWQSSLKMPRVVKSEFPTKRKNRWSSPFKTL